MQTLWQDLRFGVRMLLKSPSFTAVAVLSLALGIGANAAIFQLLDAVRLKTLPVKAAQELAEVRITNMDAARGSFNSRYHAVTNPIWEQIRDRQQAFSGIFAWAPVGFNLAQGGEIRSAKALWVSGDFFNVLGVPPILGRVFTASDDTRGCTTPGVVISHGFWQREFGGAADVIGRKLTLADHSLEIVGVTPPDFFGLEVGRTFDLALPICAEGTLRGKNSRLDSGTSWWLMVTGRLKPGWSLEQANSSMQSVSAGLFQTTLPANYPPVSVKDYLGFKLEAVPAASGYSLLREDYERPLWLLLAIAGLVLLIACANLANLLLARASTREREMAVRQAVGASRARLVRQLLAESLLLAVVGAGLGAMLAQALSRFLVSFISTSGDTVFFGPLVRLAAVGFCGGRCWIDVHSIWLDSGFASHARKPERSDENQWPWPDRGPRAIQSAARFGCRAGGALARASCLRTAFLAQFEQAADSQCRISARANFNHANGIRPLKLAARAARSFPLATARSNKNDSGS